MGQHRERVVSLGVTDKSPHTISRIFRNGEGGYSGVNFGHLKSEVFRNGGGGAFWSEIPERGFLENLDKNLLFSQKPACALHIVSLILRMWRRNK